MMFQHTIVKNLRGGAIIKGRVSGELFLFFEECEDIVIPLTLGEEGLKQENLERSFEILVSQVFDRRKKDHKQKRIFVLRWRGKHFTLVYEEEYGGIVKAELICVSLIC